jgi:hypothetical protein
MLRVVTRRDSTRATEAAIPARQHFSFLDVEIFSSTTSAELDRNVNRRPSISTRPPWNPALRRITTVYFQHKRWKR